jgi:hypothetical protein
VHGKREIVLDFKQLADYFENLTIKMTFKPFRTGSKLKVYLTDPGNKNIFIDVNFPQSFHIMFKEFEVEIWQGVSVNNIAYNVKLCFSVISNYSLRLKIVDYMSKKYKF